MNQTDQEFAGWAFYFIYKEPDDPDYRQAYAERWLRWLAQWNPPPEWMQ